MYQISTDAPWFLSMGKLLKSCHLLRHSVTDYLIKKQKFLGITGEAFGGAIKAYLSCIWPGLSGPTRQIERPSKVTINGVCENSPLIWGTHLSAPNLLFVDRKTTIVWRQDEGLEGVSRLGQLLLQAQKYIHLMIITESQTLANTLLLLHFAGFN